MEGLVADRPVLGLVRDALKGEPCTLIDIGCSGGIDGIWRTFGDRLRAIGFDPARSPAPHPRRAGTGATSFDYRICKLRGKLDYR
jgi:hypothetical protein